MNKDTAQQIINRLNTVISLLSEVTQVAHTDLDAQESRAVRRAVGHVLSAMQEHLSDPILRVYPELIPEGIEYTPMAGPTFSEMAEAIGNRSAKPEA